MGSPCRRGRCSRSATNRRRSSPIICSRATSCCARRSSANGPAWAEEGLTALGATLGKPETVQLGFDANKYTPVLRTLDRYGHRLDEVEFHPAWHELLGIALRAGLHSSPWADPKPGAHVARAAGTYMLNQIESGVYCPVAMTYGSVPTLAAGTGNRRAMATEDIFARLRQAFPSRSKRKVRRCSAWA